MQILRPENPTTKGAADSFTGDVYVDTVMSANDGGNINVGIVHFTPGARTAWHTHPNGQILVIMEGVGRVCREGGKPEQVRPGDRVWFAPNERHWHGATPDRFMMHIAIQSPDDAGNSVSWAEHVSDAEYLG